MTEQVKLEPCAHCGAELIVRDCSSFHPDSDDCYLSGYELDDCDYDAWNRRASRAGEWNAAIEAAAKAADAVTIKWSRSGSQETARQIAAAIRALRKEP